MRGSSRSRDVGVFAVPARHAPSAARGRAGAVGHERLTDLADTGGVAERARRRPASHACPAVAAPETGHATGRLPARARHRAPWQVPSPTHGRSTHTACAGGKDGDARPCTPRRPSRARVPAPTSQASGTPEPALGSVCWSPACASACFGQRNVTGSTSVSQSHTSQWRFGISRASARAVSSARSASA